MSKRVLIYARYSTDRQNEVSIETQLELCRGFVDRMGWKLIQEFSDAAISGTDFLSRPGIQALMRRVEQRDIDIVLCVTVDRISRDAEHGNGILKRLKFNDVELWTVQGAGRVSNIEMGLGVTLSQELVEQIRFRTREGMKTSVRKGKSTTCLAFGYKIKLSYDAKGDRIPGLREINDDEAKIVVRIFEEYANGVSPQSIARQLNAERVPGHKGRKWRDTTIRGRAGYGEGIINNETYLGRLVWNRRNFRKNPDTERRIARRNSEDEWVVADVPEMRIVTDDLWKRVKVKQKELRDEYDRLNSNPLNGTHRATYLLSGILECAECGGSYTVRGKARYRCTNRHGMLPVEALGGQCCSNKKTILRKNLEDRVLSALPAAFMSMGIFDTVAKKVLAKQEAQLRAAPSNLAALTANLEKIDTDQKDIIRQITERATAGRPHLSAHDDMLDELELERQEIAAQIAATATAPDDFSERIEKLRSEVTPEGVELIMNTILFYLRDHADTDAKQPYVNIVRMLVQKVVIGPTPGHQPPSLQVHGRIASILAAMEASSILEQRLKLLQRHEFLEREENGELDTEVKKKELLSAFAEELDVKRQQWRNLQVSVVAGAGFEPAAFRL